MTKPTAEHGQDDYTQELTYESCRQYHRGNWNYMSIVDYVYTRGENACLQFERI